MPSRNQNHLSCRLALLDQPVRLARLLERELCTDDRPDNAAVPEAQDVAPRLLDELGFRA